MRKTNEKVRWGKLAKTFEERFQEYVKQLRNKLLNYSYGEKIKSIGLSQMQNKNFNNLTEKNIIGFYMSQCDLIISRGALFNTR